MGRTSQKFYLTEETTVKTTYEVEKIISFTAKQLRTIEKRAIEYLDSEYPGWDSDEQEDCREDCVWEATNQAAREMLDEGELVEEISDEKLINVEFCADTVFTE